jgi:N-acetylmuramoyl-L-alanine amidase CwlA
MVTINRQYVSSKNTYNKTNAKKYIVIHETDNFKKGADGLRHARAQYNVNLGTSVHFYCGSDGIYQTAELDKCVWSVGKKYTNNPNVKDATNYNTINIEICVNEDGDYNVARQNAIELVKWLMAELGLSADRVIRHYDACGKHCPRKMMDNSSLWDNFKKAIVGKKEDADNSKVNKKVLEFQSCAIADGFTFPLYGADGVWGSECESVASKAIVKKRVTYKYRELTKIVQRAVGLTGDDVDGKCGKTTKAYIIAYQKAHGLVDDGCVGLKTWKVILGV